MTMPQNLSAVDRIRAALKPGEEIRWLGHPRPAAAVRWRVWKQVALFLVLAGVGWWLASVDPTRLWLWHSLVWLFGILALLSLSARFWMPRLMRRGIAYAVTNRRVLIAGFDSNKPLRVFSTAQLREMVCLEENDGTGSVLFEPEG